MPPSSPPSSTPRSPTPTPSWRRAYPGEDGRRQPVHTVYVPADRVRPPTSCRGWGAEALAALDEHARRCCGACRGARARRRRWPTSVVDRVRRQAGARADRGPADRLRGRLRQPRATTRRTPTVAAAAAALARRRRRDGGAAPFHGIRFKSFEAPTRRPRHAHPRRCSSTRCWTAGGCPTGFVRDPAQGDLASSRSRRWCWPATRLEAALGLAAGALGFEIQVETPQSILGPDGTALVARMVHAADRPVHRRCTTAPTTTRASCGIAAAYQRMDHPAADHAKAVMQVAAAGTGVRLSDGSTNVLPVGDRGRGRARPGSCTRGSSAARSSAATTRAGTCTPRQLPTRYAAVYAFYREGLAAAAERLRNYVGQVDSGGHGRAGHRPGAGRL